MSGERARRAFEAMLPAMLFVLLVAGVYADPLFLRRNFGGRDPLAYHYPLEKAIHDAYARGRLPVWISEISGGRPLLANPNVGALYPVRPLLSRFSFPFAVRLFPILHFAAAGVGMVLLLRLLSVSAPGAWVGAVTYVFSGVSVCEVFYPNIHPGMALLPWIAWAMARPSSGAARGGAVLAIPWALVLLAGDVFAVSLGILVCVLWILLEAAPLERPDKWRRLVVALLLAGLAAAPQIVAAALWIPETSRAVTGLRVGEVVLFSISPFRLLELVIPFPFGTVWDLERSNAWGWPLFHNKQLGFFTSFYCGAFAVIALVATRRERAPGARFGRWLLAIALAISVPPSLFPASWGEIRSPVPLRYPEKFAVAIALALAVLAGLGFDAWRKKRPRVRGPLFAGVALALAAVAALLFPGPSGRLAAGAIGATPKLAATAGRLLPGALAEAGLLWIATVVALEALNRGTHRSVAASLALLTVVPIAANRKIAPTFAEEHLFAPSAFDRYLTRADPRGDFRTLDESAYSGPTSLPETDTRTDVSAAAYARRSWQLYTHALWGRGTVFNGDLDSGDLSRLESLRRFSYVAAGYRDSEAFFGALSLKWGVRIRDQDALAGYRPIHSDAFVAWDEHEAAFPDIRLARKWREETGSVTALNDMRGLEPGEIVVESGARGAGTARPGSLRVLEKSPERLRVAVETPDPTWLFVLRAYWNHRTVLLDGEPAEDAPAQLAFSAVRVPAGAHVIDWRERVPGGTVTVWGPVLSGLALLWIFDRARRERRRGIEPRGGA